MNVECARDEKAKSRRWQMIGQEMMAAMYPSAAMTKFMHGKNNG